MGRLLVSILACTLAGPAFAGTSLLGDGTTNWFYACANGQTMNILVRHRDRTSAQFALLPGQRLRGSVQRGDVVAWHCGGAVTPRDGFIYVVTLP